MQQAAHAATRVPDGQADKDTAQISEFPGAFELDEESRHMPTHVSLQLGRKPLEGSTMKWKTTADGS